MVFSKFPTLIYATVHPLFVFSCCIFFVDLCSIDAFLPFWSKLKIFPIYFWANSSDLIINYSLPPLSLSAKFNHISRLGRESLSTNTRDKFLVIKFFLCTELRSQFYLSITLASNAFKTHFPRSKTQSKYKI